MEWVRDLVEETKHYELFKTKNIESLKGMIIYTNRKNEVIHSKKEQYELKTKNILTKMKQGIDVELSMCQDHPVKTHFLLGQKIGITGTPAIIKSNGELLPGYLPPEELLTRLNSI